MRHHPPADRIPHRDDVITSPHNARVTAARKLRQRKERAAAGAFLVEGPHAVTAALTTGRPLTELFVTPAAADREIELLRLAAAAGVALTVVSEQVAHHLADTQHPQGVFAVAPVVRAELAAVVATAPRLVAVLDQVADPGNAGTVIRTADAAGADAVVLTRGSVDPYGGKCVRASAGSLFHLPIVTGLPADAVVPVLRDAGLLVLAADVEGDDLDTVGPDLERPTAWLFGNEAHGLAAAAGAGHRRVRIPMYGRAESLNLAVAAGVCLYASAHAQRR